MCFANSVLQLLVHTPPFWNLLKELGDLKGQHGEVGAETGGGATPLVDATMKFFEEFVFKDESLLAQQPPQQAAERKPREDEEARKGRNTTDSFEPMYMYDAMKEKILLKNLLVRSCAT
jgi:ubiquitin carboxyl-terminal hydrolase 10